jgi:LacI family transcriptional regulator
MDFQLQHYATTETTRVNLDEAKEVVVGIGIDVEWPLPHHYDVIRGILERGRELGWTCRIEPVLETSTEFGDVPSAYDGIIARASPALAECCERLNVPLVNVWANSPARFVPTASANQTAIGKIAAEFLLKRGFRNFGFMSRHSDGVCVYNLEGIQTAIRRYGCECHTVDAYIPWQLAEWHQYRSSMNEWLSQLPLPVAIITTDDLVARHLVDHCTRMGLTVPDDIAVVSCQTSELVCGGLEPTITAVDACYQPVGRLAVEMLKKLIAGEELSLKRQCTNDPITVYAGRSTATRAVSDRIVARSLRYIWDHSDMPISVTDVASEVGVSRRVLERRFNKSIDQTVNDAILQSRIDRAKRILIETDEPIKFVAYAAGFSGSARLAQVFRKHVGMTPKAFRASHSG